MIRFLKTFPYSQGATQTCKNYSKCSRFSSTCCRVLLLQFLWTTGSRINLLLYVTHASRVSKLAVSGLTRERCPGQHPALWEACRRINRVTGSYTVLTDLLLFQTSCTAQQCYDRLLLKLTNHCSSPHRLPILPQSSSAVKVSALDFKHFVIKIL